MPSSDLPPDLKAAVAAETTGSAADLRAGTTALSQTYKKGGRSTESMDFSAYLAARLPATYAAVAKVLDAALDHIPTLAPTSLIDVGSGPGTASWAAVETFGSLTDILFLDSNKPFLDLALRLAKGSANDCLRNATGILADLGHLPKSADLVIAAYALAEVSESRAATAASALWSRSDMALVLVEPGTPAGFARLRLARDRLIAEGAAIAAPCPHAATCPMTDTDWCHFSVRLARSRAHMQAKGARVPFEDEKFAYLIASRLPTDPAKARILSPTSIGKPGVALRLCGSEGVSSVTIAKREGPPFKRAKKVDWGDAWE